MNSEYNLIPTDTLFAKISDQLSVYTNNGLLDEGAFFAEVSLVINKLGIAAYEMIDAIVTLENHKAPLPCNFYMLDSAWLCDAHPVSFSTPIIQSNFVLYSETQKERICQTPDCSNDLIRDVVSNGVIIQSTPCNNNNEHVLDKVTIKEYVVPGKENSFTWNRPILLTLRNKKSIGQQICTDKCKNLFAKSPYEITISQQGTKKYLHSTLQEPVIYLKYYAYPEDPETGLPLIPEEPIIQRAIEYHLMHYFFYMTWLNGNDVNIEKKVQALRQDRDMYMQEALNYSKMPSFNKAVEMARKSRKRWAAYEVMSGKHY